jgi:hypothetical protein
MAHCDSVSFAVDEAKAMAEGLPKPPQPLEADSLQYWPAIIGAKRLTAWTDADLLLACQLARDLAAIQSLSDELATDGRILTDHRGKKYAHPAGALLDQATRRVTTTARALQIHAIATTGATDAQGKKNETFRNLAKKMDKDDDLIPRVRAH